MRTSSTESVLEGPDDLTADWLTTTIGAGVVSGFQCSPIGTGQVSDCHRISLNYAPGETGPQSVILKVASGDDTSRQTGAAMGLYASEVRFYREIAPHLAGGPIPPCYHAAIDDETGLFHLLLGDAAPAVAGDEIRGATPRQARLAVGELGRLHRMLLDNPALARAEWLDRGTLLNQEVLSYLYTEFLNRYGDVVAPQHRSVCDALVAAFDDYLAAVNRAPRGLIHGDYRLDNMLFGETTPGHSLTVVDWQGVMAGPALTDLAYFVGGALTPEQRGIQYDELLRTYHTALGPNPGIGVADVRAAVRQQSFMGVMSIAASVVVERTERGDQLFMTTLARHCSHVIDTGALALLTASEGR